jgi:hypothetical protein
VEHVPQQQGPRESDTLRAASVGTDAQGRPLIALAPVIVPQHELRIAYLLQCVEALAQHAGVTLPTPPQGYIRP